MRTLLCCALGLLLVSAAPVRSPAAAGSSAIRGDYVEARTASVFAGACHYNGELVTTGHEAVAAWNFASGSWEGVSLAGVRAVAAVASDANLGQQSARKTELVVDSSASEAQVKAVASLLKQRCGQSLGQIVSVRRGAIAFKHTANDYRINADGFAALSVRPMPNGECCKQPNLVWYTPLSQLEQRKVGYTQSAAYTAGTVGDAWERAGENSAFYGTFSW
jgi:hypothetical protein